MDHYSILDPGSSPKSGMPNPAQIGLTSDVPQELPKIDALQLRPEIRFKEEPAISRARIPREENGASIADIALSDLDAILQLLAERAEYITHATGAAIALWEGEEMVCRASSGQSAPALGARLQVDAGLSGESIRTCQTLRCDDVETDKRVNRESCRAMGISSVVVLPLVRSQEVRGLFELFSDQAYAFAARDLEALERLGEMVDTALEHADAARANPGVLEAVPIVASKEAQKAFIPDVKNSKISTKTDSNSSLPSVSSRVGERNGPSHERSAPLTQHKETNAEPGSNSDILPNTAAAGVIGSNTPTARPARGTPDLANIRKCECCGFPVSDARKLCLDCEAKSLQTQPTGASQNAERRPELSLGGALHQDEKHWIFENRYMISAVVLFVMLLIAMLLSHSS